MTGMLSLVAERAVIGSTGKVRQLEVG